MQKYVYKQDNIIYGDIPEYPTKEAMEVFIDQYNVLVNNETNARIILNLLNLKDFPTTETKIMIFKRLKDLRKLTTNDKKAIVVDNLTFKLVLQSILFVAGHNQQIKYFEQLENALDWLRSPVF